MTTRQFEGSDDLTVSQGYTAYGVLETWCNYMRRSPRPLEEPGLSRACAISAGFARAGHVTPRRR